MQISVPWNEINVLILIIIVIYIVVVEMLECNFHISVHNLRTLC